MGVENPNELITAPLGGMSAVKGSRWAHAAWQNMADQLNDPSRFRVIQPMYNTDVPQSAGTHDFDACCDFMILGMSWDEASQFGRRHGIANWHRKPSQGDWDDHNHGFPIPQGWRFFTKVGIFLPGQLIDYRNDAIGLSGMHTPGSDPQPHPDPQFIFDYDRWLRQEEDVQLDDPIGPNNTVRDALRDAVQANARLAQMMTAQGRSAKRFIALAKDLDRLQAEVKDDATREQVRAINERAQKAQQEVLDEISALAEADTPK